MYCPKCSMPLAVTAKGIWHCTSGGLELSQKFGAKLAERFEATYRPDRALIPRMRLGHWWCPSCGIEMGAGMECPECRKSLSDFHFELVEIHPHADGKGRWK